MSARAMPQLALRPMLDRCAVFGGDFPRLAIEELAAEDYSEMQREAWARA